MTTPQIPASGIKIGMRIRFWGPAEDPDEDLGVTSCEDVAFAGTVEVVLVRDGGNVTSTLAGAAAELRYGDLISSDFIKDFGSQCPTGTPGAACHARLARAVPGAFLPVSDTVRHPAPSLPGEPGGISAVQVTTELTVPTAEVTRETLDALTAAFGAMGWTVTGFADWEEPGARR
jgi:hypothetical protein